MRTIFPLLFATLTSLAAFANTASAQAPARPDPAAVKDVKAPAWSANAEAGALVTTGNSANLTFTGGSKISRLTPETKLELTLVGALAKNGALTVVDAGNDQIISSDQELDTVYKTTAQSWAVKGRFDKFLSTKDTLWAAGLMSGDELAGKELVAGGQLGYARYLLKEDDREAVAELGYDYSFENLVGSGPGTSVHIHSARAFVGYKNKLGDDTSFDTSVEALINVNELETPTGTAGAGDDLRVNAQIGITTKLSKSASLNVSFAVKFDANPAPLGVIAGYTFAPGYVPEADKLDTISKASLIYALF